MNRSQRRAKPVPSTTPLAMRFLCIGRHGLGCPDKAQTITVLSAGGEAITPAALDRSFRRIGWTLAVFDSEHPSGASVPTFDPLCPACGSDLHKEIVYGGGDEA